MDITNTLIDAIVNKIPLSYCKYGDGEFFCSISRNGCNCDNDSYTEGLKNGLINSFVYMANNHPNSYIGLWFDNNVKIYWESLTQTQIKWADYHSLFLCDNNIDLKLELYKTIQQSKMNKIIICNELLVKSKLLFNIDHMVNVKLNNWFDTDFELIKETVIKSMDPAPDSQNIIITCAGMGSKVLICELAKLFPNNIYLDFGSALDKISTKKTSRGWEPDYSDMMNMLKYIIPDNWEDSKYECIYETAKSKLGVHL